MQLKDIQIGSYYSDDQGHYRLITRVVRKSKNNVTAIVTKSQNWTPTFTVGTTVTITNKTFRVLFTKIPQLLGVLLDDTIK